MKQMQDEEARHIKENLSEEELEIFDLLYKDKLTKEEEKKVKLAAQKLYSSLVQNRKKLFVIDWQNDQRPRENVRSHIISVLNEYLPDSYDRIIFKAKSDIIFDHLVEQANMGYNWIVA